jgi:hypothetical protein
MPRPPDLIDLRVRVSPALYAKIGEFRHSGRFDSKNSALVCLLAAGLAAMAKPPPIPQPGRPKRLVPFAGAENGRESRQ